MGIYDQKKEDSAHTVGQEKQKRMDTFVVFSGIVAVSVLFNLVAHGEKRMYVLNTYGMTMYFKNKHAVNYHSTTR